MKHLKISKRLARYLFAHLPETIFWSSLKLDPIHIYMNLTQSINDLDPGSGMCYIPTPTTLIQVITRLKLLRYYITQELPDLCHDGDFKPNISLNLVDFCYYDEPFAAFTENIRQYTHDNGTPISTRLLRFLTNQDADPLDQASIHTYTTLCVTPRRPFHHVTQAPIDVLGGGIDYRKRRLNYRKR
jgi:hypothetical protein